jgi:PncC family amidohydrolase
VPPAGRRWPDLAGHIGDHAADAAPPDARAARLPGAHRPIRGCRAAVTGKEHWPMETLLPRAAKAAALLKARGETLAVAESSTGGLISAALLAQPGASAYFRGAGVIYTRQARAGLLGIGDAELAGFRPATERYAALLAERARARTDGSLWGLGETGATGPTGNRYGDAAGHCCIAVVGPGGTRARTLETGSADRIANMRAFAAAALELLIEALEAAPPRV